MHFDDFCTQKYLIPSDPFIWLIVQCRWLIKIKQEIGLKRGLWWYILFNIFSESIELSESMPIYDWLKIYWWEKVEAVFILLWLSWAGWWFLGHYFALERLVWVCLVYLVWYVWFGWFCLFGRFGMVGFVWFGRFRLGWKILYGLEGLVWLNRFGLEYLVWFGIFGLVWFI